MAIAALLGEPLLTEANTEAKQEMLARLTASYKLDYFDEESVHFHSARELCRLAVEDGFTVPEFFRRLDWMRKNVPYKDWTTADFFKPEREQLYPRSWMLSEMKKDSKAASRMQFYKIDGQVWYRYTPPDGSVLPFPLLSTRFDDVYTIPDRNKPAQEEEPKPKTMTDWYKESEQARMKVELELARVLEDNIRLTKRLAQAQEQISALQDEIYRLTETEPEEDETDFEFPNNP